MNIDLIISKHRLTLDNHYEDLVKQFCNIEGYKSYKSKERFLIKNWFGGYLFTLFLGLKINEREKTKGKKIDKAPSWGTYLKPYKYGITKVLAKPDILMELNLSSKKQIETHFDNIENLMSDVQKICVEFSNGGLKYLQALYDDDNNIFDGHDAIKSIYENAEKK